VRWLNGSKELLLALQVYPTSDCGKDMGRYGGYRVETDTGTILRQSTETELKAAWPAGCPSPVWPTAFWGAAELESALKKASEKRQ
jgi:hypothetical protein